MQDSEIVNSDGLHNRMRSAAATQLRDTRRGDCASAARHRLADLLSSRGRWVPYKEGPQIILRNFMQTQRTPDPRRADGPVHHTLQMARCWSRE